MQHLEKAYNRLVHYNRLKSFQIKANDHDDSATLVNNLESLSGQCNNIVSVIAEIQAAKNAKDGDKIDAGLDKLKGQMKEFMSVSKIAKSEMLNYLKPMIKG